MSRFVIAWAFGAALVAAPAQAAPRMAGFDALAQATDRVEIKGVGWGRGGQFTLAGIDAAGRFSRSADEAGGLGFKQQRGTVRFSLAGPGVSGTLAAECGYGQDSLSAAAQIGRDAETSATVLTRPLTFSCSFSRDGQAVGMMVLRHLAGRAVDIRTLRVGTLRYGGEVIRLRSVHTFEGSKFPAAMPLGYAMARANADIAAGYFNGNTRLLALPKDGPAREAALMAGLALALMWDPGDGD